MRLDQRDHQAERLVGVAILSAIIIAPPGLLAVIAVYVLEQPALAFVAISLWCLLTALIYLPLEKLAAASYAGRRENLLLVATGGLAPLFHAATMVIEHIDADLTMRGLLEIHRRIGEAAG